MILDELEVLSRVESPNNLLNRLRAETKVNSQIPSIPPSIDTVVDDIEQKLAFGSLKGKAIGIMNAAMNELHVRLPEVQRPEKLAAIAEQMSKVISNSQIKNDNDVRVGQIIVYAPRIISEEVLDVAHYSGE